MILFTAPFRILFVIAAAYGLAAITAWSLWLAWAENGVWPWDMLPGAWHAHEMIYGMGGAALGGFILTASANWTATQMPRGRVLIAVFLAWLAGRLALPLSLLLPDPLVALLGALYPLMIVYLLLRTLWGRSTPWSASAMWSVVAFAIANILSLLEITQLYAPPWATTGPRLGAMLFVVLAAIIGGRIIPLFTANWLNRFGGRLKIAADPALERLAMGALILAIIAQILGVDGLLGALIYAMAAAAHALRLAAWRGDLTHSEPLVRVLHVGYAAIPAGFALIAFGALTAGAVDSVAALHVWTMGVVGLLLFGIMARVGLGHTGRPITASRPIIIAFHLILGAMLLRVVTPLLWPQGEPLLAYLTAGGAWAAGAALFLIVYWPILSTARVDGEQK
ncbi:NnrS family protein [Magnetofaba australis]|uniref:Putative NnrS family protein n=1 Tax=Magnetofaba australis IT-1 TaxID=1434232 RepID=A0A1Y2K4X0_9PROT|nr:NnrS family protein [Magnetofaba australis]OSM04044.1 putative NnrS family protein [Magnetofaba australis IT-1]